jgi:16S rRNA (guanine527-N7)-methyltransferase
VSTVSNADDALREALTASQRSGFLGDRAIGDVIEHARAFVRALGDVDVDVAVSAATATSGAPSPSVLDLGAGGGVPGLVIANDRPDIRVTLLDRRAKRTDFLVRAVSRLGWTDRVTVVCTDVDEFAPPQPFDAVVARGFGPPERTLIVGTRLIRAGGRVLISEPPDADRWPITLLEQVGVDRLSDSGDPVAVFRRR